MKRVTAGIIERGTFVLLARRKDGDSVAGKWEFPGGKIEIGETAEACLARELIEELGLGVKVVRFFMSSIYVYPKGQIELLAYLCTPCTEITCLNSHSEIRWVSPGELTSFDLAPADIPIAEEYSKLYGC